MLYTRDWTNKTAREGSVCRGEKRCAYGRQRGRIGIRGGSGANSECADVRKPVDKEVSNIVSSALYI